ncbi:IS110 family transposase [Nocardia sp. CA-084685]|uniref:IS110 family transposase n=1 Tax=Nocardia sp. CA-084685 TaxID=3239970 RepID=UPI003D97F091
MTHAVIEVTAGIDTHKDTHTAAAIDAAGRTLGSGQFPATPAGYAQLLSWLQTLGTLVLVGIEGTGAYGAGVARYLAIKKVAIVEIDRPDRKTRRMQGKSDPIDALAAARAALAGERTGTPKQRDGLVEALRNLRVARRSAVAQRSDTQRQIKSLIITAPAQLRTRLAPLTDSELIKTCLTARPDIRKAGDPAHAVKITLRHLARRHSALSEEITQLDATIKPIVAQINSPLLQLLGVGPDIAGQLLVTAGDNPDRIRSESAFAMLVGTAPLPASSGRIDRHRLNRGGDRQANSAIHRIVVVRMRWDPRTRAYTERRTQQGLSKKDIMRCLKRLVTREIYHVLKTPKTTTPPPNTNT